MKRYVAELTSEGRNELVELVSKGKAAALKITHARVLLQLLQPRLRRQRDLRGRRHATREVRLLPRAGRHHGRWRSRRGIGQYQ